MRGSESWRFCGFFWVFLQPRERRQSGTSSRHGDEEMGSLVSDTQSALPRHRACCNRKPGNGTRAVFVAISGTSASRERFQPVSTTLDPNASLFAHRCLARHRFRLLSPDPTPFSSPYELQFSSWYNPNRGTWKLMGYRFRRFPFFCSLKGGV